MATIQEPTFWGMRIYELLTLVAILVGPIVAVIISVKLDEVRRKRDDQFKLLRMLVNTRALAGDPSWTAAINMIPVEFKGSQPVMKAWNGYMDAVRYQPTAENQLTHSTNQNAKQTRLIYQVMKALGVPIQETDLQTTAYVAGGLVQRDNLYLDSLAAQKRIADALERQADMLQAALNRSGPAPGT